MKKLIITCIAILLAGCTCNKLVHYKHVDSQCTIEVYDGMTTMKRGTLEATLYTYSSNIIVVSVSDHDYTNGGVFLCHHGVQTSSAFKHPDFWTSQQWIWVDVKGNGRTHVEGK